MKAFSLLLLIPTCSGFYYNPYQFGRSSSQKQCNQYESISSSRKQTYLQAEVDQPYQDYELEENLAIENALNQLLLEQIGEESAQEMDSKRTKAQTPVQLKTSTTTVKAIEKPVPLLPEIPVELIFQGKVRFGNFLSYNEDKNSVTVRLSSGKIISIDIAQIISVWSELSDTVLPTSPESWAEVTNDGLALLTALSPRKSNLADFWSKIGTRSQQLGIDSQDLAIYIFQERKFRAWIDPYVESMELEEMDMGRIYTLSAAERFVAALLLMTEDASMHFKRRISKRGWVEDYFGEEISQEMLMEAGLPEIDVMKGSKNTRRRLLAKQAKLNSKNPGGVFAEEFSSEVVYLVEGGYKRFDESTVRTKEVNLVADYYTTQLQLQLATEEGKKEDAAEKVKVNSPYETSIITRYIRVMELYALSAAKQTSKMTKASAHEVELPKHIKRLLSLVKLPETISGAQQFLSKLGWTAANNSSGSSSSLAPSSQQHSISMPWTADVLAAASQLSSLMLTNRQAIQRIPYAHKKAGNKGDHGRIDYRLANEKEHPVFCLDSKSTSFYDDAISIHPEKSEILIHVVDIIQPLDNQARIAEQTYLQLLRQQQGQIQPDQQPTQTQFEALKTIAKERVISLYLPTGPAHMFPPLAVDALRLSTTLPNEVLTVAMQVNFTTGEILKTRLFPSIIGPVVPIDTELANEVIEGIGLKQIKTTGADGIEKEKLTAISHGRTDLSDELIADLRLLSNVVNRMLDASAATASAMKSMQAIQQDLGMVDDTSSSSTMQVMNSKQSKNQPKKGSGHVIPTLPSNTAIFANLHASVMESSIDPHQRQGSSNRKDSSLLDMTTNHAYKIVNTLLTCYANVSYSYVTQKEELPAPLAFENRDKILNSLPRRFATSPLRNWLAQQQQRQIRAALLMQLPLTKDECALAVTHYSMKKKQLLTWLQLRRTTGNNNNHHKATRNYTPQQQVQQPDKYEPAATIQAEANVSTSKEQVITEEEVDTNKSNALLMSNALSRLAGKSKASSSSSSNSSKPKVKRGTVKDTANVTN